MTDQRFWAALILLAMLTYLVRLSFVALMRGHPSDKLMRVLTFVPVTVLPALVAPMVMYPASAGGHPQASWIISALIAVGIGAMTKNMLLTIIGGMAVFLLLDRGILTGVF